MTNRLEDAIPGCVKTDMAPIDEILVHLGGAPSGQIHRIEFQRMLAMKA